MQITLYPVPGRVVSVVTWSQGQLYVNGEPFEGTEVPYGEEVGYATGTDDASVEFIAIPSTWVAPPPEPPSEPSEAELLAAMRAGMVCARWQIIIALGETRWNSIIEYTQSADAPWPVQIIIDNAQTIPRISETVDLLQWLLGIDDAAVDDLFIAAMALTA